MKRIIIHIGYNKTGTSAIQSFCSWNRTHLQDVGICYPATGIFDSAHYGISEFLIGRPVNTGLRPGENLAAVLGAEIAASGCEHVIVSSEYLSTANSDQITKLKNTFHELVPDAQIKVIAYLRRHDQWFESLFNQAEKTAPSPPWQMDIRDYVLHVLGTASPECSYLRVLDRWARIFGDANVIVRPFEAQQFAGGSLITDFFSALDLQIPDNLDVVDGKHNESLSAGALYVIGTAKRCLSAETVAQLLPRLVQAEGRVPDTVVPANYGKLDPAHRHSLYMFFLPEYNAIARRFMSRPQGGLFQDVPQRPR